MQITLNGHRMTLACAAHRLLLDLLRDDLGLTGTKEGCGTGDCGACTALLNGKPVNTCLILAGELDGADIVTIEGLRSGPALHPLQRAFIDACGAQCGYCTPGMLMNVQGTAGRESRPYGGRNSIRPCRQFVPLHRLCEDRPGGPGGCQSPAGATRHQAIEGETDGTPQRRRPVYPAG